MITDQTLDEAIVEALRFVKAAKALRDLNKEQERVGHYYRINGGAKGHAACKRASMDLTRKLADLRAGR